MPGGNRTTGLPGRALRAAAFAALMLFALPASAQEQPATPGAMETAGLVWHTLIALDHANRTGNYTVLRDLAAPGFRAANDAARLAAIFAPTRAAGLPLGQAVHVAPQLSAAPEIDEAGMLRLRGQVPLRPRAIAFDMLFVQDGGMWRLFGLSVAAADPPAE